jgi:cobalamin-dependent methionine synthase I
MKYFPALSVKFPEREIFLRLGGHLSKTVLSADDRYRFQRAALRALEVCHPQGGWEIFPVDKVTDQAVILSDGSVIKGGDFARRCAGITHLWAGAVTLGKAVTLLRDEAANISDAAVYDAVASECADEAMDLLHEFARQELMRQAMTLELRRYSPGYGDMALDIQAFFFEKLNLAAWGMSLSETYYMIPEKSVTAFAGVRQEL